jgi:hypothetical protein
MHHPTKTIDKIKSTTIYNPGVAKKKQNSKLSYNIIIQYIIKCCNQRLQPTQTFGVFKYFYRLKTTLFRNNVLVCSISCQNIPFITS